jgi:hypothetical protein
MMAVIRFRIRVRVEKIIEIIVHAAAEEKLDSVVDGCVVRRCQNQPATRDENAMNFRQHAFRGKRVMLYHVRVRYEVEREGDLYGFFTTASRYLPDESVFVLLVDFVILRTMLPFNLTLIASV